MFKVHVNRIWLLLPFFIMACTLYTKITIQYRPKSNTTC